MPRRLTNTPLARHLWKRLRASGLNLDASSHDVAIRRLYPGRWQRSQGPWSWALVDLDGRDLLGHGIGSQDRARDCARAPRLGIEAGDFGVRLYPEDELPSTSEKETPTP